MLDTFMEMMSYPFMVRAFLVGSLVALCSALLGVSLVLKRYSMIGDGLSHVGFGALAIAAALNMAPLAVAIPVVVVAAVLLLRISGSSKIKGDAAIARFSSECQFLHWYLLHQLPQQNQAPLVLLQFLFLQECLWRFC